MKKTLETNLKKELNERGLKATLSRERILSTFSKNCHPMNADMIMEKLKKESIDLVTIYRTLTSFEAAGILKKVDLHKDSAHYELNHHHHHIVCTDCGTIEEFDECDGDILVKKALSASSRFTTIQEHSLEFFGICKECVKG